MAQMIIRRDFAIDASFKSYGFIAFHKSHQAFNTQVYIVVQKPNGALNPEI